MRPIHFSRRLVTLLAGAVAAAVLTGTASAQNDASYPTKPVRIVVGFAAGGGNDQVARIIGPRLFRDPRPAGHRREPARSGRIARGHLRAEPALDADIKAYADVVRTANQKFD
jgi:hypothetical protein